MNQSINPFQQLYVSDSQSENFVELFSDVPLQGAINPIFQGENVVLKGTQGCGKTMILNLLRPETRIAYTKSEKQFPVSQDLCRFISAGVNLTRSAITQLVQVTLGSDDSDERDLPLYFADFFNYWVVEDLLKSVSTIGNHPKVFESIVNLQRIPQFVECLTEQDCWFDTLKGVTSIDELRDYIAARIKIYRKWVGGNYPSYDPPRELRESKTDIGEPIARTAECLRKSGVVPTEVPILIRVDQIEELHRTFSGRQKNVFLGFRKIINRAFANRDNRVHYRAGTRRYGWETNDYLRIWGSEALLEVKRDYLPIDMDKELFIKTENKNTVFPLFAEDAFRRRVEHYLKHENKTIPKQIFRSTFGKSPSATERISELRESPKDFAKIDRALGLDSSMDAGEWSTEWRHFLHTLYCSGREGMLDAVLAAAWGRQTGGGHLKRQHREDAPPDNSPWNTRQWWRKERLDQAVLQLLTRRQQRFMWWGYEDILSLSGGNINVFLHICHRIWDGFLKYQMRKSTEKYIDLLEGNQIPLHIQADGILFASNEWYRKLPEEPGGESRQRFVDVFGRFLNQKMLEDLSMSYPGGNGISIAIKEFTAEDPKPWMVSLHNFLKEAVGYGVLLEIEHSSKSKKDGRRLKYHLNPILCPRYQIPEARTKEPYYRKLSDLYKLASNANVTLVGEPPSEQEINSRRKIAKRGVKNQEESQQMTLFLDGG